ncbi:MAG: type IV fimbrial biogenesis protein FimT [Alphaproteobacteria bacterium]|jgi:type IV fimbrial biogenesis protein FimT
MLELLVSIATLYVVLGFAAPSAKRIIDVHRIAADVNHTNAMIRYARTLAISQYQTTKICPASDHATCTTDWDKSLIVFVDMNSNNLRDIDEPLLAASSALSKQHKIKGPRSPIQFYENGENASPASLTICPKSNDNTLARALFVSLQGRIRLSIDHNQDGIHERIENVNLVCTSF